MHRAGAHSLHAVDADQVVVHLDTCAFIWHVTLADSLDGYNVVERVMLECEIEAARFVSEEYGLHKLEAVTCPGRALWAGQILRHTGGGGHFFACRRSRRRHEYRVGWQHMHAAHAAMVSLTKQSRRERFIKHEKWQTKCVSTDDTTADSSDE